jgi:kynurenine formamidase
VIVDLSHPISNGMHTYPGLAPPELQTVVTRSDSGQRLADGVSFEIGGITLVGNTGTYLDAPYHYHAGGADIASLPLERLVDVPIVVVHALEARAIGPDVLPDPAGLWGKAVLFHTGWSRHWGTPRYLEFANPFLTRETAEQLVAANAALVGIDSLNIDDPHDLSRPAHDTLLDADIPILEHLTNLRDLPDEGALLIALPAPIAGMASFPVRAVAVVGG